MIIYFVAVINMSQRFFIHSDTIVNNLKNGISVNSLDEANEKISEFRLQTTKG